MIRFLAAALALSFVATPGEAAYTVTYSEVGGDVVAHGTGTLDVTGLRRNSGLDQSGSPFIEPSHATQWTGSGATRF